MAKTNDTGGNAAVDWNGWDDKIYISANYAELIREDEALARFAISSVVLHMERRFGCYRSAVQLGAGGVLRGAALVAPLLADDATLHTGDVGIPQIRATRAAVEACRRGDLGIWELHQRHFQQVDPRWTGAFRRATCLATVGRRSIFDLEPNSYDVITLEFVPESATNDRGEWEDMLACIFDALKPGGFLHMAYMIGSTGYRVGQKEFPACSIMPDDVTNLASGNFAEMDNHSIFVPPAARQVDDPHEYAGMGVFCGIK